MTLRSPFKGQQLLFLFACGALFLGVPGEAQTPPPAAGPDVVLMQDGHTQQTGRVLGASPSGVQLQMGNGVITLPMASIKEVRMATIPPDFAAAQRAMMAKDYPGAQRALKGLEKYRGLPAEWAQQAAAMAGDLAIEMGQIDKAEAAYQEFQKMYPSAQGGPQAEVGMARLAVAKQDFAAAKAKLEPITAKALADKSVPPNLAFAYSQAFYLMGQVKELADKDYTAALQDYLRTVTLFYADRGAVTLAQEKADQLRKEHPEIFIP